MKQPFFLAMLLSATCLSGCSPLNTQFSCNATAGDHCLSIEEVDAMTQTHEEHAGVWRERVAPMKAGATPKKINPSRLADESRTIWVAPWRDAKGVWHKNDTLWADAPTTHRLS